MSVVGPRECGRVALERRPVAKVSGDDFKIPRTGTLQAPQWTFPSWTARRSSPVRSRASEGGRVKLDVFDCLTLPGVRHVNRTVGRLNDSWVRELLAGLAVFQGADRFPLESVL